ncbi:MAG TPA: choice-of-anchor Q domain-containing protein [Candidatus Binatia bacterium]|jgi:hypothetical protein|nr:choice-of-anchor Q domain-containing protein [Candidatus Binatia bacterium]
MTIRPAWIAVLLLSGVAGAQTVHTFPADCTTLQECVQDAASGDVVRIATATPIDESPTMNRSVTLESAPGVEASLAPGRFAMIAHGELDGDYTIRGLRLQHESIRVIQGSTGAFRVVVEGNTIEDVSGGTAAIEVSAFRLIGTCGPIDFTIRDNTITGGTRAMGLGAAGIRVVPGPYADATGVIVGNRFTALVPGESGDAIAVDVRSRDLTVDVIGNRTAGERYETAVALYKSEQGGTLTARVANNVVTGGNAEPSLEAVVASVTGSGRLVLDVANNSVSRVQNGIVVIRREDAVLDASIGNNIVAHASELALGIDDEGAGAIVFGTNLVFDFAASVLPAHTLLGDPRFASVGDLHLQPGSPAIDAGEPVAFLTTDADGGPRTLGEAVDLGAFEAPAPADPGGPPTTCDAATCDDGDPCSVDACVENACTHAPRTGVDGARCACERPLPAECATTPAALRRAVDRACRILAGSDGAAKSLRRVARAWQQAIRRSSSRTVAPSCAQPLGAALRDARSRTLDATTPERNQ